MSFAGAETMTMIEPSDMKPLRTEDLVLDAENPRFFHLMHRGKKEITQTEIEKEILENDDDIPLLTKSSQKSGVKDPIWVIRRSDGKYTVVEGNRRTVVLKRLLKEGVQPPAGVQFALVNAHVIPSDTSPVELLLQKARLQSGKKAWGAFNEAALTFQLREPPHLMAIEDIAVDLKIPVAKVRERIENYKHFKEYVETTGDDNPKRFAYFAECPAKVREWFRDNAKNKKAFFDLICPKDGKNKIKSVATRGGLRDFAQVLESPEALKFLLEDSTSTVEDALDLAKENDIRKAIPFINRLAPMAQDLRALDVGQLERLKNEVKFKVSLRSLKAACEEILQKIEK
jgi:hypothetical protein